MGVLRKSIFAPLTLSALLLASCGNTLQGQPIGASPLEYVIVKSRFPVYWLGMSFQGLQITSVFEDPGGAVTIEYGDCRVGGQSTCVTPLSIVTSPDNSFVPGGTASVHAVRIRGARATVAQSGDTIEIPTGVVVTSIYAERPSVAHTAAQIMTPLNGVGLPEAGLPRALPDTGFDRLPLPSQVPRE